MLLKPWEPCVDCHDLPRPPLHAVRGRLKDGVTASVLAFCVGVACGARHRRALPPSRWDTYLQSTSPVTLRSDMKMEEVLRVLLSSNAICLKSTSNEEVFYVKVASETSKGEAVCCISLAELLEAPRHLPLGCLLDEEKARHGFHRLFGSLRGGMRALRQCPRALRG